MDIRILSYEQIKEIMSDENHKDYELIYAWFGDAGDYDDFDKEGTLVFSEDCIYFNEGDFWLFDVTTESAMVIHDLDNLKENILKLQELAKED